jgi:transposase
MDTLVPHCPGLDVHKDHVVACVRHQPAHGRARCQVRTSPTLTAGLLRLADWLSQEGVIHAAMESTGVYWTAVYHTLEGSMNLLLVNAQHLKKVPGRKTDVKDCPRDRLRATPVHSTGPGTTVLPLRHRANCDPCVSVRRIASLTAVV